MQSLNRPFCSFATSTKVSDISLGPFCPLPVYSQLFYHSNPIGFESFTVVMGTQIAYAVNTFSTFTGIEGIVYLLLLILPLGIAILAALNTRWLLPKIEQEDNNRVSVLFLNLIRLSVQNGEDRIETESTVASIRSLKVIRFFTASDIHVKTSSNRLLITGYMIAALFTGIMVSSSIKVV